MAFKKVIEKEVAPKIKPRIVVEEVVLGKKCACGKVIAEGQTEVCKEHIRSN